MVAVRPKASTGSSRPSLDEPLDRRRDLPNVESVMQAEHCQWLLTSWTSSRVQANVTCAVGTGRPPFALSIVLDLVTISDVYAFYSTDYAIDPCRAGIQHEI